MLLTSLVLPLLVAGSASGFSSSSVDDGGKPTKYNELWNNLKVVLSVHDRVRENQYHRVVSPKFALLPPYLFLRRCTTV